jgi:formylglycine-generating enzyme required for sulfatase activity
MPSGRRLCAGRGHGDRRVLRGGSWNNNQNNARYAYRNRNQPNNRNDNRGFRVGVSHNSQGSLPEMSPGLS